MNLNDEIFTVLRKLGATEEDAKPAAAAYADLQIRIDRELVELRTIGRVTLYMHTATLAIVAIVLAFVAIK